MSRPLIGITSQLEPARWGDWVREAVLSPASYARSVDRGGGIPVVLPPVPSANVADLVSALHGLVLSGGGDVNPQLYGAPRHEQTGESDRRRDTFELAMVRAAIDAGLPFLAICRGVQVLNVARGGTLIQHLPDAVGHDRHGPERGRMSSHKVQIGAGSKLGGLLGTSAAVAACHHQAVQRLGTGLVAVAWADDQIVEAVELHGHPFGIGVQWHPEEPDAEDGPPLMAALAEAAAEQAGLGRI
jgi:gamma-glutamyl-gamma-aminobutyrate hydrolase PuuD